MISQHAVHSRATGVRLAALLVVAGLVSSPVVGQAQSERIPDFDAAMTALRFDPATSDWNGGGRKGNAILDADELALLAEILRRPELDLRGKGGVVAAAVKAAWVEALGSATADLGRLNDAYPTAAVVAAGYAMLGSRSLESYSEMSAGFGAPLKGRYEQARRLEGFLAAEGDADGDGVSNRAEYAAQIGRGRAAYLRAALDPAVKLGGSVAAAASGPRVRTVGIILYPGFESLDVFGPVEMWGNVPEFKVIFVAERSGPVMSAQGVEVVATHSFQTAPQLDIVMVPGGVGTRTELTNPVFLDYLRSIDQKSELTTSVCTGSALLAKAGLLKGRRATSNKAFFSLATDQDPEVRWVPTARWVDDGKYLTSSGVSAGTDMALGLIARLYGKDRARNLAYLLEYQWNDDPTNDPFTREPGKGLKP